MSVSGFAIGKQVWIVRTEQVAQVDTPKTLPVGSVILDPEEAIALAAQIQDAAHKAARRTRSRGKVAAA